MADDWVLVKPKRGQKARKYRVSSSPDKSKAQYRLEESKPASTASIEEIVAAIRGLGGELKKTLFYQHLTSTLQEFKGGISGREMGRIVQIVVLGVGDFTRGANRHCMMLQMALLSCLLEEEKVDAVDKKKCYFYDPICDEKELDVCAALGLKILPKEMHGKFEVKRGAEDKPGDITLFFMPHCPYSLYCQILWQNWHCLEAVGILGNSFNSYSLTRQACRGSEDDTAADCVRRVEAWCMEQEVWKDDHASSKVCKNGAKLQYLEGAFTHTSLMHYRTKGAFIPVRPPEAEVDAWCRRNDPEYIGNA